MKDRTGKHLCIIALFLLSSVLPLAAGTTGKISGLVTDASSGDPLEGVSVFVEGTSLGTLTGTDGAYTILNVPPGLKIITATLIGHRTVSVEDVRVMVDLTSTVDFALPTAILEMPGVTVTAERPVVQKDLTSSMKVLTQQEIESLPIVEFEDVLKIQPGFVVGADNEIHVRGGRTNEINYYIDGFLIEDPLFGGFGGNINNDAIQELEVLSGTFNAEYGDALSGVVNIVTREGGDDFSGMFEYQSVMLNDSRYQQKDWAGEGVDSQRNPETGESMYDQVDVFDLDVAPDFPGLVSAFLSGPISPIRSTFFTSYRTTYENTWLPFGYRLNRDFQWKLNNRPTAGIHLAITGQHIKGDILDYGHTWKYRPLHKASSHNTSNRVGISLTHSLSENLYYTVLGGKTRIGLDLNVMGKRPEEYEEWETDPSLSFVVEGDDAVFRKSTTTTWYTRGDLTYQWTRRHNVKSGVEAKVHRIELFEVQEPWKRDGDGFALEDRYSQSPVEISGYVQDKMEFDHFIFNAGLRYDYMNPRAKMWADVEDPESRLVDVPAKSQVSPRLGLSHPITDRTVLYFSYGKFFQVSSYDAFYSNSRNLDPENLKDLKFGLVGNRDLDPQRTTAFEFGLRQELTEGTGLNITAFNKDITGLLGTDQVRVTGDLYTYNYVIYSIIDFANVKGVEFSLEKRRGEHFGANLNYTLSVARGNRSEPLEGFFNVITEQPEEQQDFYLDFDRRHVISADVSLYLRREEGPHFLGTYPLQNSSVNVIVQYASGLPYTPSAGLETQLAEKNSARMPWTGTIDLRFEKFFNPDPFRFSFFLDVTNLTNRLNVRRVDPITGDVWQVGILGGASAENVDVAFNPADVGPPRTIRFGVRSQF